jgi:hypothetical protein
MVSWLMVDGMTLRTKNGERSVMASQARRRVECLPGERMSWSRRIRSVLYQ